MQSALNTAVVREAVRNCNLVGAEPEMKQCLNSCWNKCSHLTIRAYAYAIYAYFAYFGQKLIQYQLGVTKKHSNTDWRLSSPNSSMKKVFEIYEITV